MKKIIALIVVVATLSVLALSMNASAAAGDLINIEYLATYTDPIVAGDAKNGYMDVDGEQRLFDGVVPTAEELDQFLADNPDKDQQWFIWNGWIGTAYTVDGVYEKGTKIAYDFTFSEEVNFKKLVLHAAAMAGGSVALAGLYEIYVSVDGEEWGEVVASAEGGNVVNVNQLETVELELDEAVEISYVRLVCTRGSVGGAWCFLSEVELYAEDDTAVISIDESSEEPVSSKAPESSKDTTAPTGDAGYIALAVMALFSLAAIVVVKKAR